ncbi:MAG: HAD hydrolase family protein [Thermodesulfobacteriota bacterium]
MNDPSRSPVNPDLAEKLHKIRLLALDVDGVLTDGSIIYDHHGKELKGFNVKDGLGIRLLIKAGIDVCIVSGRASEALKARCNHLGIHHVYSGIPDKALILPVILKDTDLIPEQIAFMGDDLPDIPLMNLVGLSIAVSDAHEMVRENADWITLSAGGRGAVREVSEIMLKTQGLWSSGLYSSL